MIITRVLTELASNSNVSENLGCPPHVRNNSLKFQRFQPNHAYETSLLKLIYRTTLTSVQTTL